jgi:hypothetical protein
VIKDGKGNTYKYGELLEVVESRSIRWYNGDIVYFTFCEGMGSNICISHNLNRKTEQKWNIDSFSTIFKLSKQYTIEECF